LCLLFLSKWLPDIFVYPCLSCPFCLSSSYCCLCRIWLPFCINKQWWDEKKAKNAQRSNYKVLSGRDNVWMYGHEMCLLCRSQWSLWRMSKKIMTMLMILSPFFWNCLIFVVVFPSYSVSSSPSTSFSAYDFSQEDISQHNNLTDPLDEITFDLDGALVSFVRLLFFSSCYSMNT
jgi:hypothetical protein